MTIHGTHHLKPRYTLPEGRPLGSPGDFMSRAKVAPDAVPRLPLFEWKGVGRDATAAPSGVLDAPRRLATPSGRVAILLALRMLGVGRGDRVLIPAYHCPTMVAPVIQAGALPVFYGIDEQGAVEQNELDRLDLRNVKAILATHFFGFPRPMAHLRRFCDHHGLGLLEDCAHTLFGDSDGRLVGAWGDASIASLTKFFPVPEGGCLSWRDGLTPPSLDSPGVRAELRAIVDVLEESVRFRRLAWLNGPVATLIGLKRLLRRRSGVVSDRVRILDPDQPVDPDTLIAGLGPENLRATVATTSIVAHTSRARIVERRRRNYAWLADALWSLPGARVLWRELPAGTTPYVLPLWADEGDECYFACKSAGLPVFRWDQAWPGTPAYGGVVGGRWARHLLQLPCHQSLTIADLEWIATTLRRVFGAATPIASGRSRVASPVRTEC